MDPQQAIADILERLDALYEEAETTIDAIDNPDQAFTYASEFADKVHDLHREVDVRLRELRGRQAIRIRDANTLVLRRLADRVSVSKSRVDQLIKAAEAKKEEA
jgi:hypothetical protein